VTGPRNGYQGQAKILRALAHPVRLRILDILARQEACVCHLEAVLKRPQPYVSQQLAALREARRQRPYAPPERTPAPAVRVAA